MSEIQTTNILQLPSHHWETMTNYGYPVKSKTWFRREQGPGKDEFWVVNPEPELLLSAAMAQQILFHSMGYAPEDPHRPTCAKCRFVKLFDSHGNRYLELTNPDGNAWIWKFAEILEEDHAYRFVWPD